MADVRLAGVTKRFGGNIAVDDLSLVVENVSFVVLLGPKGAGKTTTLRLVAGLETPDRGQIAIGQRDVTKSPPAARDVAFVFQQYSLYPHLSVYDNLPFSLRSPNSTQRGGRSPAESDGDGRASSHRGQTRQSGDQPVWR